MPTLKQKQLPAQQIRVNRGKGLFAGFREMITEAKDAIVDLLKPKTKTVTKEVTAQVKPAVYEDSDKTWLLNKIGNTYQSTSYLDELKKLGLSFKDIRITIEAITQCEYFTISDIFQISTVDFKALFKFVKLGRLSSYDATYVYGKLDDFLLNRLDYWFTQIYTKDLQLAVCTISRSLPTEEQYNDIIKFYTLFSHKDLPKEVSICMRLCKLSLFILTGIVLPRNRTLHLCPIWYMMLKDMFSISYYNALNGAGVAFGILVETIAFISKEEMLSILTFIGSIASTGWGALSSKTKSWVTHKTDLIFNNASSEKYLCWNKTLSVLIDKSVSESQACRMLSTFTFGATIKDSLKQSLSGTLFIKRLSPIPTRSSVYEIITFFRSIKEYLRRRNRTFTVADGEIKKMSKAEDRLKVSYKTYFTLLKLDIAFIPNDDSKRTSGCFIDPTNIKIDNDLILEIAKRHYTSKSSSNIFDWVKIQKYKSLLKKVIKDNPSREYIQFFGYPKNSFFLIGNKAKHYTLTK